MVPATGEKEGRDFGKGTDCGRWVDQIRSDWHGQTKWMGWDGFGLANGMTRLAQGHAAIDPGAGQP